MTRVATSNEDIKDDHEIHTEAPTTQHQKIIELEPKPGCEWEGMLRDYKNHIKDECQFIEVECPLNEYFNCCSNNDDGNNTKILKCNLKSIMNNDVNYLSKHFKICFDNYLDLKKQCSKLKLEKKKINLEYGYTLRNKE